MNRAKLINRVATRLNLNEIEVGSFIGSIFDTMAAVFRSGRNINIPEFGKFIVREKTIDGEKTKYVTFSPSKKFADEINNNFSSLSPVLTRALNLHGLSEIKITETGLPDGEEEFVSFDFEDTETAIQFEAPETEQKKTFEHIVPAAEEFHVTEEIPAAEETGDVPYLIPVLRSPSLLPEEKKEETPAPLKDVETEIVTTSTEPAGEILTAAGKPEDHVKNEVELIEERIITEKEIILKDIEEYIKSKEETPEPEAKEETPEPEAKEESGADTGNYFIKANVYGADDPDNNFAVEDLKSSDVKPQNVFEYDDNNNETAPEEREETQYTEPEQNVFSDVEEFIYPENRMPDETGDAVTEPEQEAITDVEESAIPPQKEEKESKFIARKDNQEESDLNDEILFLLMSREKAIHELNKYGLDVTQKSVPKEPTVEEETKKEPGYEIPYKEDLTQAFTEPESGKEETEIKETEQNVFTGFSFDKPEQPEQNVFEEKPDAVYDELDKRLDELRELTAEKESLEEELKQNIISPEMNIFEKLVEEKPLQAPEAPVTAFPEIIIHDPGDRYEDKIPKSLSDALEDVQLDGIIEHLEHPDTVIEEKSYDDVFKPADIPFVPISNREQEIKKQNKLLKFLLYFFFVVIFSIMSFFLYKSILTPTRKAPVDTLGTKVNDSIASKLSLIDTGLNKGALLLNEFEVEKEGDIIYKQTDNGFIIQIAKFDKYSDALKYVSSLDNKNIHAEIERADLPLNVTEYRIIIGTFETLQEAKSYFKTSGMLLNFIKVLTPFKTTLSF